VVGLVVVVEVGGVEGACEEWRTWCCGWMRRGDKSCCCCRAVGGMRARYSGSIDRGSLRVTATAGLLAMLVFRQAVYGLVSAAVSMSFSLLACLMSLRGSEIE
jgi:hypothetical protein